MQHKQPASAGFLTSEEYIISTAKRYIRTMMLLSGGNYTSARVDTTTGEIKLFNYPSARHTYNARSFVPKVFDVPMPECFWESIEPPVVPATHNKAPIKVQDNNVSIYLQDYLVMSESAEHLPKLDSMITGASYLTTGTRPHRTGALFAMLRDLEVISVDTVQKYMHCSRSHAYRFAQVLRIIINAFESTSESLVED